LKSGITLSSSEKLVFSSASGLADTLFAISAVSAEASPAAVDSAKAVSGIKKHTTAARKDMIFLLFTFQNLPILSALILY